MPKHSVKKNKSKSKKKKTMNKKKKGRCWSGYKPVKGKKPYSPGSCTKA